MRSSRHNHILAGTALALVLAIPVGAMAIDLNKLAFAPVAATPVAVPLAEQAPPADPLASLDAADRAVAEKLRDLLAAKADKFFAGKKERAAVVAFYQNRNSAPFWLDTGALNAR